MLDDHIYSDAATSGTITDRNGLNRLLSAAESTSRPFDTILVDDSSRLSRKLSDALQFSDRLKFADVRLVFVSQGFDSDSEQSDILMAVHGITDSQYIRELSKKTFRGLEGRVLQSLHHGGNIFGYRSTPIEDPQRRDQYGRPLITGAKLEIERDEAKFIRRLFTLYADGLSIKAVTKQLNREHVPSPRPRPGREQSWAPSSVRHILQNERYRGIVTYGRTKKVRNPQTGKRTYRHRPESEWIKVATAGQRIIPDELWNRVQARLSFVNKTYGGSRPGLSSRAAGSRYLFSGFLRCGVCHGSYSIVSGQGQTHRAASYGCPAHEYRGTCSNDRRIGSDVLETQLLAKLQHDVLSPAAVDYVLEQLELKLSQQFARIEGNLEDMRRRKSKLETELRNLTSVVADGMDSPSLRRGISEREAEISSLTAKTLDRGKNSVHTQIRDLRKRVAADLGDLRRLLSTRDNAAAMRMELAKHVKEIMIRPGQEAGQINYEGKWNLLGGDCAVGSVPRARIGLATPAFSGPRSTGELPRHRLDVHNSTEIMLC